MKISKIERNIAHRNALLFTSCSILYGDSVDIDQRDDNDCIEKLLELLAIIL